MTPRVPTHRYQDPLDRIWTTAAERIGLRVARTGDAYASTDGSGKLLLASAEHLDPDDCLAQMILHELCHWLVQGEESRHERDWGLDNETERDTPREQACLRLQAALLGRHGLRRFLGPTTDYRAYYDALPEDPLAPRWEPTVALAIQGLRRSGAAPFAPHLDEALRATEHLAAVTAPFAARPPTSADATAPRGADLADQWSLVEAPPRPHPAGLPPGPVRSDATCGTCSWRSGARGRCRQAEAPVRADWPACERWEPALDCQACGACCRAAYDCVQVSPRDPVRKKHPGLVVARGPFLEVLRKGDRCAALGGGEPAPLADGAPRFEPYTCAIYEDRPRSCRDFERGGAHCLVARRRVGLSL